MQAQELQLKQDQMVPTKHQGARAGQATDSKPSETGSTSDQVQNRTPGKELKFG